MITRTPSPLPAIAPVETDAARPAARLLLSRLLLSHFVRSRIVRGLTLAMLAVSLSACAATMENPTGAAPPPSFTAPVTHAPEHKAPPRDAATQVERDDPLEAYNRRMYAFNARLDRYVFLPVVDLYETVIPQPFRNGIGNVFDNVGEIPTFANCLLQGRLDKGGITLGRFALNTTFGLLGLFDVADGAGLYAQDEDFGQTLGVWGIPAGPYVILPVLGPSTVRDAAGYAGDFGLRYMVYDTLYEGTGNADATALRWGVTGLEAVDLRSRIPLRYYDAGTPFEYEWLRFLYLEKRKADIDR